LLAPELAARLLDGSYSGDLAQDLRAMLVKHDHRAACGHLGVAAARLSCRDRDYRAFLSWRARRRLGEQLVRLATVATIGFGGSGADFEQAEELCNRIGMSCDELINRLGGSP
jgi:hypothetical protein